MFCCLGSRFPFLSLRDLGTCSAMEMCNVASAARCGPCRGMETEGVWGTSPLDLGRGCAGRGVPLGHGVVLPGAHGEEDLNCPNSSPGKPSLWPQRAEHSGTVRMGRVWCQNISFGGFCAQSSLLPSKQHFALTRNRGTKGGANPMPTAPALRWSQEQLWVGLGKAFLGVFIKKT